MLGGPGIKAVKKNQYGTPGGRDTPGKEQEEDGYCLAMEQYLAISPQMLKKASQRYPGRDALHER